MKQSPDDPSNRSRNSAERERYLRLSQTPLYRFVVPTAAMRRQFYHPRASDEPSGLDRARRTGEWLLQNWQDSSLRLLAAAAIGIDLRKKDEPTPYEDTTEYHVGNVVDQIAADLVFDNPGLVNESLFTTKTS